MASGIGAISKAGFFTVLAVAIAFQLGFLNSVISTIQIFFGIGKTLQPLSDFPYQCRRLTDPRLESCEDMWVSEQRRELFLACSDSTARLHWFPTMDNFNLAGRSQKDAMVVIDLDQPELASGEVKFRELKLQGFDGPAGDGLLDLLGFTGTALEDGRVRFLMVNLKPSVDPATGAYAKDQAAVGANSTVEIFETTADGQSLEYIRTISSPHIATPNRVAAFGEEGFYVINDHGKAKSGQLAQLGAVYGNGDITYCSYADGCRVVSSGQYFPNGLIRHTDGELYVPSSGANGIQIFHPHANGSISATGHINFTYTTDNLSEDQNGDIYAAVHPVPYKVILSSRAPFGPSPPTSVIRARKVAGKTNEFEWEKVLEDRDGEALPATTTVVHDAKTGRLFLSSAFSPFITVCNPK